MALIGEEQAKALLGSKLSELWSIVHGGWTDYLEGYSDKLRLLHCASTRASIVHDHQIARAATFEAENREIGVQLLNLSQLKLLLIDEKFAIRFKKLGPDKRSSNQFTKQVSDFRCQTPLPGLPVTHNLEAGYVLSRDGSEIQEVCLVCPNGNKMKPIWALKLEEDKVETVYTDFFANRQSDYDESEEAEIVPREDEKKGVVIPIRGAKDKNEN